MNQLKKTWIQQASQSWTCPKTTLIGALKFEGARSLSVCGQKLYGFFTHETFEKNVANCGRKSNGVSYTEEQNVRTKEGHAKTCHSNTIKDFVVRNISTYVSGETVWSERFAKIREVLQGKDVYEPIVVNKFIQANNRSMFMTIIRHMIEQGLPFQLEEYSISYYKLPSVGSHSAVHFLWKKSINDSADCPEQLKTIHDLKNKFKTYYSRTMKHEVRKKILRLGNRQAMSGELYYKRFIRRRSSGVDECQNNVLDRLHIAIESGEDIVVDLGGNNGRKPKFEEFWQVRQDKKKTLGRRVTSLSYFLK